MIHKGEYPILEWGSHLPVLLFCLQFTKGPVIECGGGIYSTALLHLYSQRRYCRTIETNPDWCNKIRDFFDTRWNHEFVQVREYKEAIVDDLEWGVAFIDMEEPVDRVLLAEKLKHRTRLCIVHDTQRRDYSAALDRYRYKYTFTNVHPYTSVGSMTDSLEWLDAPLKNF